jgi:methylenetetrahydrofolate dehydrogenase (NADP+)/methenyltetrahydrofolate cyclohydrolase
MKILDGRKTSEKIISNINKEVNKIKGFRKPKMNIILVGNNPASEIYVKHKLKSSEKAGIESELIRFDETVTEKQIINSINQINQDETVDGLIVQLPLPNHINVDNVVNSISPEKDIDGFHPTNFGKMSLGLDSFKPATPYGITKLLQEYQIETKGKHCVVIGRSNIVGKPISIMLANDFSIGNCTVTLTHIETPENLLIKQCQMADIVVVAVGIPGFVKSEMIKPGAIVIDVGINKLDDDRLCGDVDFDSVSQKCDWITPVPGGVGPMTIAALLLNTLKSYKMSYDRFN